MKSLYFHTYIYIFISFFLSSLVFSQTATQDGEWGAPVPFGIVPVAVANLPDGRLITWSSQFPNTFREIGDGVTFTQLFDPGANGGLGASLAMRTTQTDHDMFCPGINNLADGRILSAGGTTSERTSIYDPLTDRWSRAADMNIPRGYQGNVTLPSGAVFTVGGSWSGGAGNNGGKAAELWTPGSGWINLPNISGEDIYTANDLALENQTNPFYRVDNHVWLWPAPNGGLFHAGPSEMMHWIDTDVPGGAITPAGLRGNDTYSMKGTTVMFDVGKILKVGGATSYGQSSSSTTPAKDNSFVIDINVPYGQAPTVIDAGDLQYERTMHNSTVLPNGQVLVTGGLDRAAVFTDAGAQLEAELYTPSPSGGAGTWRTVAGMQVPRTYHSVAILMTDGRVFVGGGGLCDGTPDCVNHFSAEIYSPPYLFGASGNLASRPVITSVSGNTLGNGPYGNNPLVDYGDVLQVNTDVPVGEFSLVRFSAATHSTNNEQRRIPLTTTAGTSHNLTVPGRNLLPPGYYMLFALDADGVPSVSRTLRIGTALPLDVNPNLVLDMRFDETSGNLLADSSVNGNDGTVVQRSDTGAPVAATDHGFVDGLFGNAIAFEGREHNSNSLIEIPYDDSFASVRGAVTLSAWVWRDADSGIPDAGGKIANVAVLGHDYQDGSGAGGIFFGFHNTLYKWSFRTTSGYYDNYAGYAPLAGWNHVAATYDGRTSKLYANGVLVGSVAASGDLVLNGDTADELSSFTVSGFYDQRPLPVRPYGNRSGITDEVDGRMDELKVFSSALGQDEIRTMFERGLATGNIAAAGCQGSYLVPEYSINEGEWRTDPNNRIVATEGDRVRVRALGHDGAYFLTTQIVDGPTFASASDFDPQVGYRIDTDRPGAGNPLGDGLVDVDDRGLYTMTTPDGCPTTFFIEVLGKCDPGETEIFTEYNVNGWVAGASEVTIAAGERLQLSVLPNNSPNDPIEDRHPEVFPIQIILPNGNSVGDGFTINSLTSANEGRYTFISAQGCTKFLDVTIAETDCNALGLESEYQINGGNFIVGQQSVNVNAGDNLRLSIRPNGTNFNISSTSINGNSKGSNTEDLFLNNISPNDAGTYTFTTGGGCTVQLSVTVTGTSNNVPMALISATPISGSVPLTVNFDASGSTDAIGIITYSWNFGDGNTGSGVNVSNTYTTSGRFSAMLTVSNAEGFTDTDVVEIFVESVNTPPNAIASGTPLNGSVPLLVNFDASASTDDTAIVSYVWDFGDGTTATGASPTHTYTAVGNFSAILTVTDAQGSTDTDTIEIVVDQNSSGNLAPLAIANATPLNGAAPLLVDFDASASTDDNGIISYSWNFGDASTGSGTQASHTYLSAGTYIAVLTVTDAQGLTGTATQEIMVTSGTTGNEPPNAIVSATPMFGAAPLVVNFDASASTDDTGISSYSWDFGDGTTATGVEVAHTYTLENTYTAILTVTDANGLTDSASVTITANDGNTSCADLGLQTRISVNGEPFSTVNSIILFEGDQFTLQLSPETLSYRVSGPNTKPMDTSSLRVSDATISDNGVYTVFTENGCTLQVNITVLQNEAQENVKLEDLKIYPNPVGNEDLNIDLSGFINESITLGFYDVFGKLVRQQIIEQDHQPVVGINVSSLAEGFYLLEITRVENNEYTYKKIIKVE